MGGSTIVGYAAKTAGSSLERVEFAAPSLGDGEVRVRVTHCGVCHTDVHAIDNDFGEFPFPVVPGHEIAGCVDEIGVGVTRFSVGDRVGVGWQGRCCGECGWCRRGEVHLCLDIVACGTWTPHGGFSSSVAVDERFAYRLPDSMPSEVAAVLMCAGVAVFAPLRRLADQGIRKVGVVGIGGLGHLALQVASAFGFEVAALSSSPDKADEARGFGADEFIVTSDPAAMRQAEYAFDALLCTAPIGNAWGRLFMTLKKNGTVVLPAFSPVELRLASGEEISPLVDLVAHQLSIAGSFLGNHEDVSDMLDFVHRHDITPLIETMPMKEANTAIEMVRHNTPRYRVVLTNT
jgi:uncharacterized zinc-type alcohol dehydrogenase-like protein